MNSELAMIYAQMSGAYDDAPRYEWRTRCDRCGGFLPREATGRAPEYRVVYDPRPRLLTPEEEAAGRRPDEIDGGERYWTCGRCGKDYDESEMWVEQ